MNLTIPSPSLEPLLYFVTHGLLVIASAAVLFFTLGLWFGWLTWARHKRRARAFQEETTLLRHEIASLKRRIAEEAVDAPPLVPIGEETHAPSPPPSPTKASEGLSVAVLSAATTPLSLIAMPDSIQALAAQGPAGGGSTSTDSAATASYQVPVVAASLLPPNGSKPVPLDLPSAAPATPSITASSVVTVAPKKESTTTLLPSPARETTSIKLGSQAAGSITGPIHLPPLPELMEMPATPTAGNAACEVFATELAAGAARLDPLLGVVYPTRPVRWDDLTLLRGVGEVLQNRLHERGIFTFKQIASWTEETAREIAQQIEAKDRIQRDYWVQQACELHYLKYGEKVGD